jgi:hypothetical protein
MRDNERRLDVPDPNNERLIALSSAKFIGTSIELKKQTRLRLRVTAPRLKDDRWVVTEYYRLMKIGQQIAIASSASPQDTAFLS